MIKRVLVILVLAILSFTSTGLAQTNYELSISNVDVTQFPAVQFEADILDSRGFPVSGLTAANFQIFEDSNQVNTFNLTSEQDLDEPIAFVIAIDTSGSMSGPEPSPLANSVQAAKDFIQTLSSNDVVAILAFADDVSVVQDFTSDPNLLNEALDLLTPEGDTALYDAVVEATDLLKDRSEPGLLILLTDGRDTASEFAFNTAVDAAARVLMPIYPIGFGSVDPAELEQMAELTGGFVQIEPDSTTLFDAFSNVFESLKLHYLIDFSSTLPADSQGHELKVEVNSGSWQLVDVETFFAIPPITVEVTAPETEVQLGGDVSVTASVQSIALVDRVQFEVNDSVIGEDDTPPYEAVWPTANVLIGDYTVRVTAWDANGLSAQDEITVHAVFNQFSGGALAVVAALAAIVLIVIPVSLRSRRRRIQGARLAGAAAAELIELKGLNQGKTWKLVAQKVTLGRKADGNTITVSGRNASRFHAAIAYEQGQHIIRSIKPDNPVILNGKPVLKPTALKPGDVLRLGESQFRYQAK